MVRVTYKKTVKIMALLFAIISCATDVVAVAFDSAGARIAIDKFKTLFNAMDLSTPKLKLQKFNEGLTAVKASQYFNTSTTLQTAYQNSLNAYNTQNDSFATMIQRVPLQADIDTLETNYAARLKTLNDEIASLSQALASAQSDASNAVADAQNRINAALAALTAAQAYFSTLNSSTPAK